jgi:GT2 family glycosyltransferase
VQLEGKPPRLCDRDPLGISQLDLGDEERSVDTACGANMILRRSAIDKVGLFNESLAAVGDEIEWEARLREGGGDIVYLPQAAVWHRRTADDLRLWSLMRVRFQRGKQAVLYARVIGQEMSMIRELVAAARFFAHAVRRRCAGGLISASASIGRFWGLLLERSFL